MTLRQRIEEANLANQNVDRKAQSTKRPGLQGWHQGVVGWFPLNPPNVKTKYLHVFFILTAVWWSLIIFVFSENMTFFAVANVTLHLYYIFISHMLSYVKKPWQFHFEKVCNHTFKLDDPHNINPNRSNQNLTIVSLIEILNWTFYLIKWINNIFYRPGSRSLLCPHIQRGRHAMAFAELQSWYIFRRAFDVRSLHILQHSNLVEHWVTLVVIYFK